MLKTTPDPAGHPRSAPIRAGRALRIASAVGLIGAAIAITSVIRHDGAAGRPTFSPADHQVTYEVAGEGIAREITYSVGTAKQTVLHKVELPWTTTVTVVAGVGGEVVNLNTTNPGLRTTSPSAAAPVVCRILIDGNKAAQRTSTDGFADTSCSATLAARQD